MVYVLNIEGKPLMPTKRHRKVRLWLKNKQAKVVKRKPFTIQLLFETTDHTQNISLGVDSGYLNIGLSAVGETEEVFSAEMSMLQGVKERLQEKASYRRTRRGRKRYRKPRFDNRRRKDGWLAPSIQHKLDTHVRAIELVKNILPVTNVTVEVANFDIQKILKPGISGKEYQGVQKDFYNLREYILHRDNHSCQNLNCKNNTKEKILVLHHIKFRSNGGTDNPNNLITLCDKCHTPANHQKGKFLDIWQTNKPTIKPMKDATFMNMVRWKLVNLLQCKHTYGYITKSMRITYGIGKSHANDAFIIAGGTKNHKRTRTHAVEQVRRNNRSLEKFFDAQYIDLRDGKKRSGKELFSGRTKRNKNLNSENLRAYRAHKFKKGERRIRQGRSAYQPKDLVLFDHSVYVVIGSMNKGASLKLKDFKKYPSAKKVKLIKSGKGFSFS